MIGPKTKPIPPPKELRPHVRDSGYTCQGKTPCGGKCELNARYRHVYHTCRNENCLHCHGERFRFGRASV